MRTQPPAWVLPLVAGLLLLLGFVGGVVPLDATSTELAGTGVRTTGEVVQVHPGGKFPATADVRYPVNGVLRTGVPVMEGDPIYAVGDRVTVIHAATISTASAPRSSPTTRSGPSSRWVCRCWAASTWWSGESQGSSSVGAAESTG